MDFKKIAQEKTTLAEVMIGREKMDMEDLCGEEVTVIDFGSYINADGEIVYAFTTAEYPNRFTFAGMVLSGIFKDYDAAFDSHEECIKEFKECGGIRVEFSRVKNKSGKQEYTSVKVID